MLSSAAARITRSVLLRKNNKVANSIVQFRKFTTSHVLSSNNDLPYHILVGMPALSPTMETGTLSEWYMEEGQAFSAGEALAKIETDKASIDFEAQDDGYIAKILVEAGSGEDIEVGSPIMVTVEEEEDVAAFSDFVAETAKEETKEPAAATEGSPPPITPVEAIVEEVAPVPPQSVSNVPVQEAPIADVSIANTIESSISTRWGDFAKINSPILKTLSKQQNDYIEKYGTTGQVPM